MNTIVTLFEKSADNKSIGNKQFFELIDYLFNLKEKGFTGKLEIEFKKGSVDQVAFNQKVAELWDLSANE
jgi:hypothetical protein